MEAITSEVDKNNKEKETEDIAKEQVIVAEKAQLLYGNPDDYKNGTIDGVSSLTKLEAKSATEREKEKVMKELEKLIERQGKILEKTQHGKILNRGDRKELDKIEKQLKAKVEKLNKVETKLLADSESDSERWETASEGDKTTEAKKNLKKFQDNVEGGKVPLKKPKLSQGEYDAVKRYTQEKGGYARVKKDLREKGSVSEQDKGWTRNLDKALEKLPKYKGKLVRTVDLPKGVELDKFLLKHTEGAEVEYKEYISTSKKELFDFNPKVTIVIPNATQGRDISGIYKKEGEVIYERGSKFKVTGVKKKGGTYKITLEEI